jgi:NTE family protein
MTDGRRAAPKSEATGGRTLSGAPTTALVLTGGGARAAYQVGVLRAVSRIRREFRVPAHNPFPVICGTSAGAINALALAIHADHYDLAVGGLTNIWRDFTADQVYRADAFGVVRTGARWLTMLTVGWAIARWRRLRPRSLFDNSPLDELLRRVLPLERLPQVLEQGHLHALAVTASSYSSGFHYTFYETAHDLPPWERTQRVAVRAKITIDHLLASSAIPFVFPAVPLPIEGTVEWFGDGSMRQAAPISPAVHLGAERVFVIGAGRMSETHNTQPVTEGPPNLAQIAGHALSNIFLDALAVDIERLQRVNRTLNWVDEKLRPHTGLRPIEVLVIAPSQRIDDIAARHVASLPTAVRALLRSVGVSGQGNDTRGAALASYLLFEAPYTKELIELGETDALARRDDVARFFGWSRPAEAAEPTAAAVLTSSPQAGQPPWPQPVQRP